MDHRFLTTLNRQVSLLREVVTLLRSAGDRSLMVVAALVVASGLVPVASVYVTRGVVDRLVTAMSANGEGGTMLPLLLWAAIAGGLLLIAEVIGGVLSWVRSRHEERLKDHITARIHDQSARLDLAFYESPAFFDRLHRAREEASYRPAELCQAFVDLLQGAVTLVGLAAVLVAFGPWLPALLVFGAAPIFYVVVTHALHYQQWRRQTTQDERRAWYYDYALTSAEYASELRVFGWAPKFQDSFRSLRARLRQEQLALTRRRSVADALAAAASLGVMGVGFAWIVQRALQGLVSLGQLAGFAQAFATGLSTMRSLLSGLGRLYANSLFIEDLTEFLSLEPEVVSPKVALPAPRRVTSGIRFRDVTFHYPGTTVPALTGFNLHIPAGKRVAIVGPNGAGKSTLVKLMCRLYDPVDGAIEIDGIDLRSFVLTDLRRMISPLFQEPARYFQSAGDNLRLGCPAGLAPHEVGRAAAAAGASRLIESLPNGYDTLLGKWFDDGTELSTGEWQRMALARSLARPSQILVLDEPTSALDPWTEADWYGRFCDATQGRTAVIITHRLTTAMQADLIHVMAHGRVVESGTHDSLMARGGQYAQAWAATLGASNRRDEAVAS